MPNTESFVPGPFDVERLDCYQLARQLTSEVARLTRTWRGYADLADQVRRAAISTLLNLAEGAAQPRGSGNKRKHYAIARGSVAEVAAALDAATLVGIAKVTEVALSRSLAARVCAMLTRLSRA